MPRVEFELCSVPCTHPAQRLYLNRQPSTVFPPISHIDLLNLFPRGKTHSLTLFMRNPAVPFDQRSITYLAPNLAPAPRKPSPPAQRPARYKWS